MENTVQSRKKRQFFQKEKVWKVEKKGPNVFNDINLLSRGKSKEEFLVFLENKGFYIDDNARKIISVLNFEATSGRLIVVKMFSADNFYEKKRSPYMVKENVTTYPSLEELDVEGLFLLIEHVLTHGISLEQDKYLEVINLVHPSTKIFLFYFGILSLRIKAGCLSYCISDVSQESAGKETAFAFSYC